MNSASNAPVDTAELIDAAARERVEHATDVSLFVEAGAGTGKTRALVRRIGRLLLVDGVGIDRIAAITFTEKAAGELRDRLRQHLVAAGDQKKCSMQLFLLSPSLPSSPCNTWTNHRAVAMEDRRQGSHWLLA